MRAFRNLMSRDSSSDEMPPASVLAQWKDYESSQDVESGSGMPDFSGIKESTSSIVGTLTRAASGLSGSQNSLTSSFSDSIPHLPSRQEIVYGTVLAGSGLFFLMLSIFVALPVVAIFPSKFALTFSLGTGLIMSGIVVIKGWRQQLNHMLSSQRLPFTLAYLGSLFMTLYAALFQKSYLSSLFFSAVQIFALLYYVFSYLPGGAAGMQLIVQMISKMLFGCLATARKAMF